MAKHDLSQRVPGKGAPGLKGWIDPGCCAVPNPTPTAPFNSPTDGD